MSALASMLGVRRHVAVGLLEMLWQQTARYAPRGDIGKYKDCQIAAALDWPNDDATRLVKCLVDTGWLDESQEFRLIVHDWHEHSDGTCDKYLSQNGLNYATSHDPRRVYVRSNGESHDKSRLVTTSEATRARAQNQNQDQNQGEHPQFFRLLDAAKGNLDKVTWESWKIMLHNHGLDSPAAGMTEEQAVTAILPAVETAPWAVVHSRWGAGKWLGFQVADLAKGVGKKNGDKESGGPPSPMMDAG